MELTSPYFVWDSQTNLGDSKLEPTIPILALIRNSYKEM